MNTRSIIISILLLLFSFACCLTQTKDGEKKAIKAIIQQAYIGGAYNDDDTKAMLKGFHERFTVQNLHGDHYGVTKLQDWIKELDNWKSTREDWNNRTTAEITVIGLVRNAAVAQVDVYNAKVLMYTDFLSMYKFPEGWKIMNKIFTHHPLPYETQSRRIEKREKRINQERQPPEKVMDAIGVKPGMVIGEVGAGRGRYTVHLARRIGNKGKVYANDIDEDALAYLRERCRRNNIPNIETILGDVDDPKLPAKSLDMVIMVWVYHMLDEPIPLMKNLRSSLKPGAAVVILDPPDEEIDAERESMGEKLDPNRLTIKQRIEKECGEAGFELIRVDSFLPKDDIYILKVKGKR